MAGLRRSCHAKAQRSQEVKKQKINSPEPGAVLRLMLVLSSDLFSFMSSWRLCAFAPLRDTSSHPISSPRMVALPVANSRVSIPNRWSNDTYRFASG
jgi:hypothetical protein